MIIVDSIVTGLKPIGSIHVLKPEMFKPRITSPHYMGIPEALEILKAIDAKTPEHVYIIGIEVKDPYTISEDMSEELKSKLDEITMNVYEVIMEVLESHGIVKV